MAGRALLVMCIAAHLAFCGCVSGESDPLDVLCTGHAGSMPYMAAMLRKEPMTDAVIIPTRVTSGVAAITDKVVRRYMRLYFPRSYEILTEKHEFLILRGIDSYYFTTTQLEWMRRGIEGGLGGLQDRSVMSSLSQYSGPWAVTSTARAFPNDAQKVVAAADYNKQGNLEVIINPDPSLPPVMRPYEELLNLHYGVWSNSLMIPKEGSQTYAWSKTTAFPEVSYPEPGLFPHVLGWRYGKGYTWSLQDYSLSGFWAFGVNPYGPDVYYGLLMYSTGRTLPEDVVMVHNLRLRFHEYSDSKSFIFSLLEFVDRFGANTNALDQRIKEMDRGWQESRSLYLEQEFEESSNLLGELLGGIDSLRLEALRLKDRALFWIYVIEWLIVSATLLMASLVLWSLMVRRRLYRQVATSRLGPRE